MKKVLYNLLLFISILFVSYEVSADTYDTDNTVYIDSKHSNFTLVYEELKPKLEEINSILSNNPLNHKYVVFFGKNSNGNFINVYLMAHNANYNLTDMFCFTTAVQGANVNTGKPYYSSYNGCYSAKSQSPYNFARYEYKSSNSASYDTLITNLSNDILLEWTSSKFKGSRSAGTALITTSMLNFSFTNNLYDYFNNNIYFALPYSSNVKIYNRGYYSSSNTIYTLQFDKTEILPNSYLEPSDNYFKEEELEPNIFNEEIDDIEYSKMIFNFDIDVFKERGNILDYLIDFESIGTILRDDSLDTNHIQKFSSPYLEYVDSNGVTRKLTIDFGYDDNKETRSIWYVAQETEISGNISSLKLILPMDKTAYSRYKVNLISFIPFTISYVTNEQALSYYENVDLTGKYGVIFMPKLVKNNSDISSIFYTTGIESISVYDSYDYKKEPIEVYNSNLSEFSYSISYENIDYNLFFKVNSNTPDLGIVTYDTRYYTYQVVDSRYSIGIVINPNTNEDVYIDFSNMGSNFESMSEIFDFIGKNFDQDNHAYILFKDSLNVFFNTMPIEIYMALLLLIVIILIGTGLALGGWK